MRGTGGTRVFLTLGLLACALSAAATTALAGAIVNQTTPFAHSTINDLTDEAVVLQGTMHTVVHFGASGGRFHFGEDVRLTGMKGTALTGAEYVEMDVQNEQANVTALGPQEATVERTMNLTRLGEDKTFGNGDDMRVHVIAHMTVNANGVVTVEKTEERNECR
jgi:hypothetical protein